MNAQEEALQACSGDAESLLAEAAQVAYRMQVKNMDLRAALHEIVELTKRKQLPLTSAIHEIAKNALK